MGLFSFIKEAGEKLFGHGEAQAAVTANPTPENIQALSKAAGDAIKTYIGTMNLHVQGLDVSFEPNPNKNENQEMNDKTVVVQVAQNGKLKINNEDTNWDGLGPRMEQIFKDRAEKVAFVKGENDVLFMDVARAIDIMRTSGIDKVGLITAKLEAGQ